MESTLSSKGRVALPAEVRRRLNLKPGSRLSIEIRDGGVLIQSKPRARRYLQKKHRFSGLTVMVLARGIGRKVTPREIARLNADLL
jgi:AbrB family looped-hinge helix DNA binding protein